MANITDFSDALTKEGELAKKYEFLSQSSENEDYKKVLDELVVLSEQKMKLAHKLLTDINWFNK